MKVLIGIISLLLLSEVGWAFNYGDCVQTSSGRRGEYIETRETSILSVHAFVRWDDMPREIIDGSHYPAELYKCDKELLKQRESGGESDLAQ